MQILKINHKLYSHLNPYIIAEIGVNHEGSLELAKKLIKDCKDGGAHAAKFQSYKADKLASKGSSPSYWDTSKEPCTSQHELFQKYDGFDEKEYQELKSYCDKVGIDFMSTPFDLEAVDYLNDLVSAFKIASADITNIPLLRKVAKTKKPIILSTGASLPYEIQKALDTLKEAGAQDLCLLHCVLNYPTPEEKAQLGSMVMLKKMFGHDCAIGYSDHVPPTKDGRLHALELATTMGAIILEKHFTYDKTQPGNDHYHSMDKEDLLAFSKKLQEIRNLFGEAKVKDISGEMSARRNARRRVVTKMAIPKGSTIEEKDLIALRADKGLEVILWDSIVGKKASRDLPSDTAIEWTDIQ